MPTPGDPPNPQIYWEATFAPDACADLAAKYARLEEITGWEPSAARIRALRDVAARWPGALRECQLVPPEIFSARGRWAAEASTKAGQARAAWLDQGTHAVVLWSDLHELLADQRSFRSLTPGGSTLDAFLDQAPPHWPRVGSALDCDGRQRLRADHAYRWLARATGLRDDGLRGALFVRDPRA